MRKSILNLVTILALSIVVIVGCGGGSGSNAANENENDDVIANNESNKNSETIEMIAVSHHPHDNFVSQSLVEFSEKVKEKTDGKVEIVVHTGGDLGINAPDVLSAAKDGRVAVASVPTSEVTGDEPLFEVITLPFLMPTFDEMDSFYEIADPYFEEIFEEKWNQKPLYSAQWPYAGFWTKDKIETIDDTKGLKMRTYDTNGAKVVSMLGGSPHQMPFSEVYPALSTGVIDSVLTSAQTAVDGKFWEVLNYYVPTNVTAPRYNITINLDEFNKLDQEIQDGIIQAGEEMDEFMRETLLEIIEETEEKVVEEGIEIVEPSEEFMSDLMEIGDSIVEDYLEDAPDEAEEIIEKYRQ